MIHHLEPENSFRLTYKGGNNISLYALPSGEKVERFDTLQAKDYIRYFKNVHVENFDHGLSKPQVDSIIRSGPIYTLTVTDTSGNTTTVKAFEKRAPEKRKAPEGQLVEADMERMYTQVDGESFAVIQNFHFDRLFKSLSEFKDLNRPRREKRFIRRNRPSRLNKSLPDTGDSIPGI